MEAEQVKLTGESEQTRSSRLTCRDCAVDIDKLLAEVEAAEESGESGASMDKGSHLVFDISQLGTRASDSTSEDTAGGRE